jgi:outer membrane immunogenic protein
MLGLRRNFLATVSLLALGATASAGEWTGFYIGLNAGVTAHRGEFTDLGDAGGNTYFNGATLRSSNGPGAAFGGQFGYNWQFGNFVYGIETDLSWLNAQANDMPTPFLASRTRLDALTTVRGRVGFAALPSTLIYLTGGFSYGRIHNMLGNPASPDDFASNGWRTGWVMGTGIEYLLAARTTVRFEGLFNDFGSWDVVGRPTCTGNYRTRFSHSETTVRGAISLKW